jgi:hypothetical protein
MIQFVEVLSALVRVGVDLLTGLCYRPDLGGSSHESSWGHSDEQFNLTDLNRTLTSLFSLHLHPGPVIHYSVLRFSLT